MKQFHGFYRLRIDASRSQPGMVALGTNILGRVVLERSCFDVIWGVG